MPMLKKARFIEGMGLRLRNACRNDASFILSLRTDKRLNNHLSTVTGELTQQIDFLEKYEKSHDQAFFVIENAVDGAPLGTVRLYDKQGESFCWGSWIVHPDSPQRTGIKSALLVYTFGFDELGFNFSHFDVRKLNERVWRFHESWGAKLTAENQSDRFYRLSRQDWELTKHKYKRYFESLITFEYM